MELSGVQVRNAVAFILLTLGATAPDVRAETADPRLEFVTEYIRELSEQDTIRSEGDKDLAESANFEEAIGKFIHTGTRMQIELRTEIQILKSMHLDLGPPSNPSNETVPTNEVIPTIIQLYEDKLGWWQKLVDMGSAALASNAPDPWGQVAAQMPQVQAFLENDDQNLLKLATPLVFMVLVDKRSRAHQLHLVITKAERSELLRSLTEAFGQKLEDLQDKKPSSYLVGSALVLKNDLSLTLKCADESWE